MKIPLYDNNMNFVTTFDLHHTLADLLKTWGYVHVSVPKPISLSFSYGDYLEPSLSVYQIRIRLEHMIRNGEKHPFYFVEADNEALEFLQNYDKNDSYQISDTNYQKWKTSQIEKYAKSSPKVSPTPSTTKTTTLKTSMPAVEEDDLLSWSISVSPSPSEAPEEEPEIGTIKSDGIDRYTYTGSKWIKIDKPKTKGQIKLPSASYSLKKLKNEILGIPPSEAPHADEWKSKDGEILVFDQFEWKEINKLKVEKPKKPKKQPSKKKIGLPKEQLKRNIILE